MLAACRANDYGICYVSLFAFKFHEGIEIFSKTVNRCISELNIKDFNLKKIKRINPEIECLKVKVSQYHKLKKKHLKIFAHFRNPLSTFLNND